MKYAIELSRKQTAQIIERACHPEQQVWLEPKAWQDKQDLRVQVLRHDPPHLELLAAGVPDRDFQALPNTYCRIEFDWDDNAYLFDAHIVSVRPDAAGWCLRVACPQRILVLQRRRRSRHNIARSSSVQISREQGEDLLCHQGQLYNLSAEGLAFKISRAQSAGIEIGQTWWVCFQVPEQSHDYKLLAVVRRRVPSSCQEDVILGMQFEPDDSGQLDLLDHFFSARQSVGVRS